MRRSLIIVGLTAMLCGMLSGCCCCLNLPEEDTPEQTVPAAPVETQPATEPVTEYFEPVTEATEPPVREYLARLSFDPDKIYTMSWTDSDGFEWFARYHFLADGSCTMVLCCGYEILSTCAGRYWVDGNILRFSIWIDGTTYSQCSYRFDTNAQMLEQITQEGLAFYHQQGDRFPFYVDTSVTNNTYIG